MNEVVAMYYAMIAAFIAAWMIVGFALIYSAVIMSWTGLVLALAGILALLRPTYSLVRL